MLTDPSWRRRAPTGCHGENAAASVCSFLLFAFNKEKVFQKAQSNTTSTGSDALWRGLWGACANRGDPFISIASECWQSILNWFNGPHFKTPGDPERRSHRSEHSGACGSSREVLLQLSYYSTQSQMHQSLIMSLQLLVPLQDINCTRRQNGLINRKCCDTISEKNSFYWQYSGISLSPTPPECLQTLRFHRPRPGWRITQRCENAADGIWLNGGKLRSSAV